MVDDETIRLFLLNIQRLKIISFQEAASVWSRLMNRRMNEKADYG